MCDATAAHQYIPLSGHGPVDGGQLLCVPLFWAQRFVAAATVVGNYEIAAFAAPTGI